MDWLGNSLATTSNETVSPSVTLVLLTVLFAVVVALVFRWLWKHR